MKIILDILNEIRPEFDFSQSSDFFEDGILDSFDLMTLVSDIDSIFGISIDGVEVIPENFKNLNVIKLLREKHGIVE